MKRYEVTYYIKANRKETKHTLTFYAKNAKEACQQCKSYVYAMMGRNAFRPTAKEIKQGSIIERWDEDVSQITVEKLTDEELKEVKKLWGLR